MGLFDGKSKAKDDLAYNEWLGERAQILAAQEKSATDQLIFRRELWPLVKDWFLDKGGPSAANQVEMLEELFLSKEPDQVKAAGAWLHSEAITAPGRRAAPASGEELEELAQLSAGHQRVIREYRAALRTLLSRQLLLAMGQGQMEGYKGTFAQDEMAKIRTWALAGLPESVTKLISDDEVKAMLQAGRLASQASALSGLTERAKSILLAVGDGFHTYRRMAEALGVTRRALEISADLKRMVTSGFITSRTFDTGLPADKQFVFHLSQSGQDLFAQVAGRDAYGSQCAKFWDRTDLNGYERRQGFWIDDLRAHAKVLGLQAQVEATRTIVGTDRSVRPDLTLFKDDSNFKALPIQVELGGKDWTRQKDQVRAGVWKAAAIFSQVDLFVENSGLAEMFAKALENPPADLKDLKVAPKVPVRIYVLGVLAKDYGKWPLEDGRIAEKIFLNA